jgi:hypothetical protein
VYTVTFDALDTYSKFDASLAAGDIADGREAFRPGMLCDALQPASMAASRAAETFLRKRVRIGGSSPLVNRKPLANATRRKLEKGYIREDFKDRPRCHCSRRILGVRVLGRAPGSLAPERCSAIASGAAYRFVDEPGR